MIALAALLACATVTVTDGDSFRCDGERIRLADIDAPELRARCPSELALARRARDRLAVLLRSGTVRMYRLGRDRDRYGRLLRAVTVNGRNVGDVLVGEGLARTWSGRREPWC